MSTNNPPKNKTSISCKDEFEAFHQVSGQCWNDAAIVFLLFSSGIGNSIQKRLQDEHVIEEFETWWNTPEIKQNILDIFPDAIPTYGGIRAYMKNYMKTLRKRFLLLKQVELEKGKKNNQQRTLSKICSLKLERDGARASELLYKSKDDTLTTYEGFGYHPHLFSNVLFLMIQFFLKGNLKLLVYHEDPKEIQTYGELLKQQTTPVLIHNPFDLDNIYHLPQKKVYNPQTLKNVFDQVGPHFRLSFIASVNVYRGEGAHAISFLTCESNEYFFYDDNEFVLTQINWMLLFKDIEFNNYLLFYIPNTEKNTILFGHRLHEEEPIVDESLMLLGPTNAGTAFILYEKATRKIAIITKKTKERKFVDILENDFVITKNQEPPVYMYKFIEICTLLFDPASSTSSSFQFVSEYKSESNKKVLEEKEKKYSEVAEKMRTKKNIQEAAKTGYSEVVKNILEDISKKSTSINEALLVAAQQANTDVIDILLKGGADIHYRGDQALENAIRKLEFKMAKYLIQKGADINARKGEIFAVSWATKEKLEWILKHGFNLQENGGYVILSFLQRTAYTSSTTSYIPSDRDCKDIMPYVLRKGSEILYDTLDSRTYCYYLDLSLENKDKPIEKLPLKEIMLRSLANYFLVKSKEINKPKSFSVFPAFSMKPTYFHLLKCIYENLKTLEEKRKFNEECKKLVPFLYDVLNEKEKVLKEENEKKKQENTSNIPNVNENGFSIIVVQAPRYFIPQRFKGIPFQKQLLADIDQTIPAPTQGGSYKQTRKASKSLRNRRRTRRYK